MASSAVTYRPFTFNRSFDEETEAQARRRKEEEEEQARLAAEAEAEATPPPPTFSEEELESAKQAAYQEGVEAGKKQAEDGIESHVVSVLQTITGQLAVLHDRQALANEVNAGELARITGDIVAKLLPHYTRTHGPEEIVALIGECLEPLEDVGKVTIRVADDLVGLLEERLRQAGDDAGFMGEIVVTGDSRLGYADVRVDWGNGGAERRTDDIWEAIDAAIDRGLAHGQHLAEEDTPPSAEETPDTAQETSPLSPGTEGAADTTETSTVADDTSEPSDDRSRT